MPLKSFRSTCSLSHILEGITKRCWKAIAMSTTKKTWGSQATVMAMICYKKRGCGSTNSSAEHVIRGNMRYACSEKLNQKKKQMNSPLSLMLSPLEFWTLSFWELNDLSSEKSFHPNKGGAIYPVFPTNIWGFFRHDILRLEPFSAEMEQLNEGLMNFWCKTKMSHDDTIHLPWLVPSSFYHPFRNGTSYSCPWLIPLK